MTANNEEKSPSVIDGAMTADDRVEHVDAAKADGSKLEAAVPSPEERVTLKAWVCVFVCLPSQAKHSANSCA